MPINWSTMPLHKIEAGIIEACMELYLEGSDLELLIELFLLKSYNKVLEIISKSRVLKSTDRVIFVLSLLHLSRYEDCLLQLITEIASERESLLKHHLKVLLAILLMCMDKPDQSQDYFRECLFDIIAELANREATDPHAVKLKTLLQICNSTDLKTIAKMEKAKDVPDLSVTQRLLTDVGSTLSRRGLHRPKKQDVAYCMDVLFGNINYFELFELVQPLIERLETIVFVSKREFQLEVKQDMDSLDVKAWCDVEMDDVTRFLQASSMVKYLLVASFFHIIQHQYESAHSILQHVVDIFDQLLGNNINYENDYINYITRNKAVLLTIHCHIVGDIFLTLDDGDRLSCLLTEYPINPSTEFLHGRLSGYFLGCGLLFEHLGTDVQLPAEKHRDMLLEMLRKLIVAVNTSTCGVPLELYERILWGILMHGSLHKRLFWFFYLARGMEASNRVYKFDGLYGKLGDYENGWMLAEKHFYEYQRQEPCRWNEADDYFLPKYTCRGLMIVKSEGRDCVDGVGISMHLIEIWKETYRRYRGDIPLFLDV